MLAKSYAIFIYLSICLSLYMFIQRMGEKKRRERERESCWKQLPRSGVATGLCREAFRSSLSKLLLARKCLVQTSKPKTHPTLLELDFSDAQWPGEKKRGKKGIIFLGWLSSKGTFPKKRTKRAPLGNWGIVNTWTRTQKKKNIKRRLRHSLRCQVLLLASPFQLLPLLAPLSDLLQPFGDLGSGFHFLTTPRWT